MQHTVTISDALFTKTQQKVIGLLFQQPDASFYLNEIVRLADMGKGTIKRELEKMTASGLLTLKRIGNQNHYQANAASPIFNELASIARKTFGIAELIQQALSPIRESIEICFIYGSIAKGTDTAVSDIDLMIVGDNLAYADVMTLLLSIEKELHRPINPSIYAPQEFSDKLKAKNNFLTRVIEQDRIAVFGELDGFV